MKHLLITLTTLTTISMTSSLVFNNNHFLSQKATINPKKIIPNNNNGNEPKAIFDNKYNALNNGDWITGQNTADTKYYSYDTSDANYLLSDGKTNARTAFMVNDKGELVYNKDVTIPKADQPDVDNTKEEMIFHRKITTIKDPTNNYSGSEISNSYFDNDGAKWTYIQQGEVESRIDISQEKNGDKIDHSSKLTESLGLYYIAKAVRDGSLKLEDAKILGHIFISKSSLTNALKDTLTDSILNLIVNNNDVYNFMANLPFLTNNNSKYAVNYIFDDNNNIVQVYYSYYDQAFDLSTLSLNIPQQIISVKNPEATAIDEIKTGLISKIKDNFKNTLSTKLKISPTVIDDSFYDIIIENSQDIRNFTSSQNINFKIISSWKNVNHLNFAGTYQGQISVINKCIDLSTQTDLQTAIQNVYYHQQDQAKWLNVDIDNSHDATNVDTNLTAAALDLVNTKVSDAVKTIIQDYFKTHQSDLIIDATDYDISTSLTTGNDIFNQKLGKDFTINIKDNGSTYKLKNSLNNVNLTIHGHNTKNISKTDNSPDGFGLDGIWLKSGEDKDILQAGQHFYEQNNLLQNWITNQDSLLNTINNNSYNPVTNSFTGSFDMSYNLDNKTTGSISANIATDIKGGKATNFWDLITKTKTILLETDVSTASGWNLNNVKLIFSSDVGFPTADNTLYTFDLSSKFNGIAITDRAKLVFNNFKFNINYQQVS